MIRAPLWQISIWGFCLFHFQSSFFLQLYLFCICKVIKLNNVCASIGSTEKKPSRDLVSHTEKKKACTCCVLIDLRLCKLCVFALVQKLDKYITDMV